MQIATSGRHAASGLLALPSHAGALTVAVLHCLSIMMKLNVPEAGAAIVLFSLGTACASGDDAGSFDGGSVGDSGNGTHYSDAETIADAAIGDADGGSMAVDLGSAGSFAILAKAGIPNVPTSTITGSIGVSPAAASDITGFSLTADPANVFSTSLQVTEGYVYASDDLPPTPANLTTAVADMQLAFTDAASRAPRVTELRAGNVGGMTLPAGVYKWGTGVLIPSDLTLSGSSTDVWIFEIAQNLNVGGATTVRLVGGALSKNVFWQVTGLVEVGTTAHFEGVVLTQSSVALRTGASINGRLLAQGAVSIDGSAVVRPAL